MEKMKLSSEVPEELASMLGEDKKKKRNPLSKKKKILISAVALVTAGSIVAGSIFLIRSKKSDNTQTVYREYTVARGDILEGQTESSVITLDRKTVDFPVNAEVLEIYVKSGSQVKKGDKLIKLSAEDIDDSLKEYEADLKSAQTTLESAKLNRKTELLKAQQELESSKQSGSQSDDALSVQLEQAEFDLQSKKDAVTKAQKEYNELVLQQSSFSSDKSALDSAESTVNSRQAQVDKWQEKQSDYNEINSKLTS
ncbi:MAG TPA: hypothetical protein DDY98_02805, partial [Ruminococcaceae bacterium]|nr:hypothetical protein [Oscillospiraceae bacterium]